jgi:type VI secretion system protein ImpM
MKSATVVGFYGKLPCRGDFLRRRVPQEFVDVWDAWVRESLSESRRQLRDRWLEAYLTSPVWRFVLTEGLCGRDAYAGLILPSVDRVGRYFPLTIVARWEVDVFPLETACNQERWFESAEALALHALEAPSLDFDDFDRGVARLAAQLDASVEPSACLPSLDERRLQPLSLWWTDGLNEIAPAGMLCVTGLPEPSGFAAMLSGERAPGWTQ